MSNRMTLDDFLKHVQGVYKSIDIRTAAIKRNDKWQNALTVIRFSCLAPNDVEAHHMQLETKWGGKIHTGNFRIEMNASEFDVETLEALNRRLNEGRWISIEGSDVHFERSTDIISLMGGFEKYGNTKREAKPYTSFEAIEGPHCMLLKEPQLRSEVRSVTLEDPYLLIHELLEVAFDEGSGFDLVVAAPFYSHIEHIDFGEQRAKIQVHFHENIEALALRVIVRQGDFANAPVVDRVRATIKLQESEKAADDMMRWTKELDLSNATPSDYLDVELIQTAPAALIIEKPSFPIQIGRFLDSKQPAREPLLAAFQPFVSLDQLEEYLKNPTKANLFKKSKIDASTTFELAVGWLLGFCGLSVIWLGQTIHEVIQENKATRFSVDMLAYKETENTLLLVGCTIGIPNDRDTDNVKAVRRILLNDVFKDTNIQIKPFVFSAAPELGNKERDGVLLLDADDITGILNRVREWDVPRALSDYFGFSFKPKT